MESSRRDIFKLGAAAALLNGLEASAAVIATPAHHGNTRGGPEGQRQADLGNGTYRNPVLAGDNPDPNILKDAKVYYKVSSTFDYYPGLLIWRSDDLVNWVPLKPALSKVTGSIFAPDLIRHGTSFFIYFAAVNYGQYGPSVPRLSTYVIHAESMEGPWSDPVDLSVHKIDPGHVVGEDGKRYLFLADGLRVQLSDDGLKTVGEPQHVFDGWPIPPDWVVEGFSPESPKLLRHNSWFYAFWAEGGTAGPPTSHMVVVARSRSIEGPWENCPHNPIVRTQSAAEPWWSRGHATSVEGPLGDWWLVYHGYENSFRTLGRQMLLEPMIWTQDGWPRAMGGDLRTPLRKPLPSTRPSGGMPLSDDFSQDHLGTRFTVFSPRADYLSTVRVERGKLLIAATGKEPSSGTVVTWNAGDRRYMVTAELEVDPTASAALLLYYNQRAYSGLGASPDTLKRYKNGRWEFYSQAGAAVGRRMFLRVINDAQTASFDVSADGKSWRREVSYDVTGLNHNNFDLFLSLRPAIVANGEGVVIVHRFDYRALPA